MENKKKYLIAKQNNKNIIICVSEHKNIFDNEK